MACERALFRHECFFTREKVWSLKQEGLALKFQTPGKQISPQLVSTPTVLIKRAWLQANLQDHHAVINCT